MAIYFEKQLSRLAEVLDALNRCEDCVDDESSGFALEGELKVVDYGDLAGVVKRLDHGTNLPPEWYFQDTSNLKDE